MVFRTSFERPCICEEGERVSDPETALLHQRLPTLSVEQRMVRLKLERNTDWRDSFIRTQNFHLHTVQ